MEQSILIVNLPDPLLLKIAEIANEENKSSEEVIIELLRDVFFPASQVPPQEVQRAPDLGNSHDG
jgi:hypothetical protein